MRVAAARGILDGKLQEFFSALMVGSPKTRQWSRDNVMSATEALLDAHEDNAYAILLSQGLDPSDRDM